MGARRHLPLGHHPQREARPVVAGDRSGDDLALEAAGVEPYARRIALTCQGNSRKELKGPATPALCQCPLEVAGLVQICRCRRQGHRLDGDLSRAQEAACPSIAPQAAGSSEDCPGQEYRRAESAIRFSGVDHAGVLTPAGDEPHQVPGFEGVLIGQQHDRASGRSGQSREPRCE